uniref:Uncharacterized protein n=1 Tax=Echeneis naucrates TaxID=173247 RepID=A0A665X1M0_ECHNA
MRLTQTSGKIDLPFQIMLSPYGSMARKRSAQEGVQGAPVNKRKSLLMKPRHYSPSEGCEEESEDLAPPQDKEELRNIDTPAGKQMSCCFVCFDEQLTLNFKIPSVCFVVVSDGNLNGINGVTSRNGGDDAVAKSNDSVGWSEVTSDGSPQRQPDTSDPLMDEDEEELLNNEENQSHERMSGTSSPQSPYGNMREAEWEPMSLSAKVNSLGCSPSRASDDLSGRNVKEEPHTDLGGPVGRASIFQTEVLRYRPQPTEEDSEGETEVERSPRLNGWALGLHERGLEMSRGRVNFSLLEQAIALQTEQRQVLHHAYREMDRFLMEQMSNERRQHRMMDMDTRLNYPGGKGNNRKEMACAGNLKNSFYNSNVFQCELD